MESVAVSIESDQTTSTNTNLHLFEQTLGNNESFFLTQIGRLDLRKTFIAHIKNNAQRIIFIVTFIPGEIIPHRQNSHMLRHTETVIQMTTASGQVLLTVRGITPRSLTVWSGANGQYLGNLKSIFNCCNVHLTAKGSMEEYLFHMNANFGGCFGPAPSEFHLISMDVRLASTQKTKNGSEIRLFDTRNIDSRTKAFLIFVGYLLYNEYFAETSQGRTGSYGLAKNSCCCITTILVGFLLLMLILLLIVLSQHDVI